MSSAVEEVASLPLSWTLHRIPQESTKARIARGAFGELTIAVHLGSQGTDLARSTAATTKTRPFVSVRLVAIKTVYQVSSDSGDQDDQLSEIACLQRLGEHPNIVPLLDAFATSGTGGPSSCMVLPYCPIDLHTVLKWKRQPLQQQNLLSYPTLFRIARHLLAALHHCHAHNLVHGDVKPGNLLINVDTGTLQLCDFGIAANQCNKGVASQGDPAMSMEQESLDRNPQPRALCTLQYRPPEILLGLCPIKYADSSMDMFSAGVTLAECITGKMLFPGTSDLAQLTLYFQTLGTPSVETWPGVMHLPNWDKVSFLSHAPDPQWIRQTMARVSEFPPNDALTSVIQHTIQLDPSKRWSAQRCLDQVTGENKAVMEDSQIVSQAFVSEMVPLSLRQMPLLLSPPMGVFDPLEKQIEHVARTRRDFESSLHPWNSLSPKLARVPG